MAELISPVAIGVISDPPTIVLSYDCMAREGEKRKRRKRKMPLRDFTDKSNVKRYAFNLRQRHSKYLANVIDVTLEKMLRMIQEIQKGNSVERALKVVNKGYSIDEREDLNKISPAKLAQRKAVMDEMFHKNLVKPGDPDFVYDREVKFEAKPEKVDGNDWDEESEKLREKDDVLVLVKNEEDETKKLLAVPSSEVHCDNATANIDPKSESVITPKADEDKEVEILDKNAGAVKNDDDLYNDYAFPKIFNTSSNMQMKFSPSKDDALSRRGVAMQKSDDDSSSTDNIEEALVKIESGGLEEEDEDFWQ